MDCSSPVYATRQMKADLLNRFTGVANVDKCVMREMFRFLCADNSAAENRVSSEIEDRLLKVLLCDDVDIVYDMRCQNGNPSSIRFDAF